jgi:hypothetical protein
VNSAQPLRLALSPSRGLAALILALHGIAALCILTVLTGWLAVAAAVLALALGAFAAWDRALLRSGAAPLAIEIRASGEAACLLAGGREAAIQPKAGGNAVTRHWVSLRLRSPWRRSLLVTAGMLPPESFRRLRLWAQWGQLPAVAWRQRQVRT